MHTAIGEQDKETSSVNVWTVGNTEQIIQPSLSYPDNKEKTVGQNTEISQSEYDVNPIAPKNRFGSRHVFALMAFFGLASVYMMRINLSVAIVDMINSTSTISVKPNKSIDYSDSIFFTSYIDDGSAETCPKEDDTGGINNGGEFDWDPGTKGLILGAFYWGYMVTQIPGGIMAEKYGGKWVFAIGILLTDLFCVLTPVAARYGGSGAMIAMRILTGLSEGVTFPTATSMVSKWVPSVERTTLGAFVMAGTQFGTVLSLPLSGWLCEIEFDNGWPLTFYVPGAIGIIWFIAWCFLVYDNPSVHPRINEDEKRFILASTGNSKYKPISQTPWLAILASIHFWAILIAQLGHSWGLTMLLTELPSYMKGILHYDLTSNGLVSALPYLAMWLFSMVFSVTADYIRKREILSTTTTRKIFTTIGLFLPACGLIGASYTGCDRTGTLILLTLASGFNGAVYSGFFVNGIDIASNHAGSMMGITNCVGSIAGFVTPDIIGLIVTNEESLKQWQLVFFISAGVYIVCNLFYLIFGIGVEQAWNKISSDEKEGDVQKP